MKQYIWPRQVHELENAQKDKLWDWAYKNFRFLTPLYVMNTDTSEEWEQGVVLTIDDHETCDVAVECFNYPDIYSTKVVGLQYENKLWMPLLSIGQMIEFLDEFRRPVNGEDLWHVPRLEYQQTNGDLFFDISWDGELCDALWQKVKAELEN